MDIDLSGVVDKTRIVAADAALVPAPSNSLHPGDHLLVNCLYHIAESLRPPQELLDDSRNDAIKLLRCIAALGERDFVSTVVTVYGQYSTPSAVRPARRRIYRLEVLSKDLPSNGAPITADFLAKIEALESSELDEVAELLQQTVN